VFALEIPLPAQRTEDHAGPRPSRSFSIPTSEAILTILGPLGLLLKSPELDLETCVGDAGRLATGRACWPVPTVPARSDVPVGVGLELRPRGEGGRAPGSRAYELDELSRQGVTSRWVKALIDTIMNPSNRGP